MTTMALKSSGGKGQIINDVGTTGYAYGKNKT